MNLEKSNNYITFNKETFITDYFDKEGDKPLEVMILNLPIYGIFKFKNKAVNKVNFTFKLEDINYFTYLRLSDKEYTEEINFKTSDNNSNKKFSNMATMIINVSAKENLPPIIGNNEIDIEYNSTYVFTQDDFTTNTTPPYSDPEGNPPYKLKVLSLPVNGIFTFNGINITVNQEILFTDINSGLLQITGTKADINGESFSFNFTISDTGSQIYA